jgi:hypothetical protein
MEGRVMGVPWCQSLPVVDVPQRLVPKPVTIVMPFYMNDAFLRQQIGWWGTASKSLRGHLNAIIVDDCSPTPAVDVLLRCEFPFPIRLFRIEQDVRWNWLAARNIGFQHADHGWVLVTDMDHVAPVSTLEALVYGQHNPKTVYALSRMEHSGEKLTPHSASFFMTREMFWRVGGYDERMSGFYGSDGYYRKRLSATAPMAILSDRLIRHEYQGDSSTQTYKRKQPEDGRLRSLVESFPKGSKPKVLSFPYHEVPLMVPA